MAKPRAVVHVIAAKAGTHQLLEQPRLFIRALGAAKARQRFWALRLLNSHQAACRDFQRFVPAGFAEVAKWIGRVKGRVERLGNPR